jgi:hypothetical protein
VSDDDGYVHDPAEFREEGAADARAEETRVGGDTHAGRETAGEVPRGEERTFGLRGWILVGWLVVAFVVVPVYLYFFPNANETLALFGLGYRETYLVLPLVPAIVLGILAVWATTRP